MALEIHTRITFQDHTVNTYFILKSSLLLSKPVSKEKLPISYRHRIE